MTGDLSIPLKILGFKASERPNLREIDAAYKQGGRRHPLLRKAAYETLLEWRKFGIT
jgi:hypothetical protein